MDHTNGLRGFFLGLAEHTGTPLHAWHAKHGHAWPAIWDARKCVYHHCLVLPYVGGNTRRIGSQRAIPRIHLNHHDPRWHAPATQLERRARAEHPGRAATQYGAKLELTATMDELPLLVAWVVAWAKAKIASDGGERVELAAPPVALENPYSPEELLACDYAWTRAATDEYSAFYPTRTRKTD